MNILYKVRDKVNKNKLKDKNILKNKEFLKEKLKAIGGESLVGSVAVIPYVGVNDEVFGWASFSIRIEFDKYITVCVNHKTGKVEKYSFIKHLLRKYK